VTNAQIRRVSAAAIEAAVIDQLRALLKSPEVVMATWRAANAEGAELPTLSAQNSRCSGRLMVERLARRNGLNRKGSYPCHPLMREQTGRMRIGGSSKFARTAEGKVLAVWFRLRRLR